MHTYIPSTINWHKFGNLYQINDDYLSVVKLMVIFINFGGSTSNLCKYIFYLFQSYFHSFSHVEIMNLVTSFTWPLLW